jgi:methylmalonyl-CoA mutase C-terminal domain/subunit
MAEKKIRILLGKIGLDGHDRGVRMLAAWLRNMRMEVVYIGTHNTPEATVNAAA